MSIVQIKATDDQSFSVKKQPMAENFAATQKFSVKVPDIYLHYENYVQFKYFCDFFMGEYKNDVVTDRFLLEPYLQWFLPKASTMFM